MSLSARFERLGRACARHAWIVVVCWVVLGAASIGANLIVGGEVTDNFRVPGTESQNAIELLGDRFPAQSGGRLQVVFAGDRPLDGGAPAQAISDSVDRLRQVDGVAMVKDPLAAPPALSPDRTIALASVLFDRPASEVPSSALDHVRTAVTPAEQVDGVHVEYGGDLIRYQSEGPGRTSEIVGLAVAVVVLLIAFGTVVAMGLPIAMALVALGTALPLAGLLGHVLEVNTVGPILVSMIGIAVGIDYSLFVLSRHRENLRRGHRVGSLHRHRVGDRGPVRGVRRRDRHHRDPVPRARSGSRSSPRSA